MHLSFNFPLGRRTPLGTIPPTHCWLALASRPLCCVFVLLYCYSSLLALCKGAGRKTGTFRVASSRAAAGKRHGQKTSPAVEQCPENFHRKCSSQAEGQRTGGGGRGVGCRGSGGSKERDRANTQASLLSLPCPGALWVFLLGARVPLLYVICAASFSRLSRSRITELKPTSLALLLLLPSLLRLVATRCLQRDNLSPPELFVKALQSAEPSSLQIIHSNFLSKVVGFPGSSQSIGQSTTFPLENYSPISFF